jgi:tRNA (cytidine/uridine-2'-O-)-methyltransferase
MDYGDRAAILRHPAFVSFLTAPERNQGRLVLIETDGEVSLHEFVFAPGDTLILGRESMGSPDELREAAATIVRIPMASGARSLNVVTAAAIALSEALRQTSGFAALERT